VWTFLYKRGSVILFISKRQEEAKKLLAKAVFIYTHLPAALRPPSGPKDRDSGIEFFVAALNSSMQALPATKDAGRSDTATLVIPDEWAFQDEAAEMFGGYEPTVGQMGEIKGVSTANGASGFFYDVYQAAKRGAGGFTPVFIPWSARPGRTAEWREEKAAELTAMGRPEMLASEYPSSDYEAFLASVDLFFPLDVIAALLQQIERPLEERDVVGPDGRVYPKGVRIYKKPRFGGRYCIGADVAEGIDGGDFSTAQVLDCGTGEFVATVRCHQAPDLYGQTLYGLGKEYSTATGEAAYLAVEKNNHGLATLNVLEKRLRYPANRLHRPPVRALRNPALDVPLPSPGWLTNSATRPELLFNLKQALIEGSVVSYCSWLAGELPHFRQERVSGTKVEYRAARGEHDDAIFAAGIAVSVRSLAREAQYGVRSGAGRLSR
jgi:hypothetical protein